MRADPWMLAVLPVGAALDLLIGDPRGWPHPVRTIGGLITWGERSLRALLQTRERLAGIILVLIVLAIAGGVAFGLETAAGRLGGPVGLVMLALFIHFGLAARSLRDETLRASDAPDLETARRELSMIVGRDTADLDRCEIGRACVETIAENANDGVIAPIVWYAIGGLAGMWIYKAANTLDSMIGYRDARYLRFGWAAARWDDLLSFVPARLTWLLIAFVAPLLGESPLGALRIGWRDGRNHPSPNSAWGEAAMAGALGIQLGGPATYGGIRRDKPLLGDPGAPIGAYTVHRAARVMLAASWVAIGSAWFVRSWALGLP